MKIVIIGKTTPNKPSRNIETYIYAKNKCWLFTFPVQRGHRRKYYGHGT